MRKPRAKFQRNFNKQGKRREPTFDMLMRQFKKKTERSGIIKNVERESFTRSQRPSVRERKQKHKRD